jgi:hypothetical protein
MLSRYKRVTFACTVGHLIDGLRKLVIAGGGEEDGGGGEEGGEAEGKREGGGEEQGKGQGEEEGGVVVGEREKEDGKLLYRGVRGDLPRTFWLPDSFGTITATDFGFMSTSTSRSICESYMDRSPGARNIMWVIHTGSETDGGYHNGADVSMLSQFAFEEEKLFPPLTRLEVHANQSGPGVGGRRKEGEMKEEEEAEEEEKGGDSDEEEEEGWSGVIPLLHHQRSNISAVGSDTSVATTNITDVSELNPEAMIHMRAR